MRNGWRPSGNRRWRGSASAALTAVRTAAIGASREIVPAAVNPVRLRLGHPHELRANLCRMSGVAVRMTEDLSQQKQMLALLREMVSLLRDTYHQVIVLRVYEGFSTG